MILTSDVCEFLVIAFFVKREIQEFQTHQGNDVSLMMPSCKNKSEHYEAIQCEHMRAEIGRSSADGKKHSMNSDYRLSCAKVQKSMQERGETPYFV